MPTVEARLSEVQLMLIQAGAEAAQELAQEKGMSQGMALSVAAGLFKQSLGGPELTLEEFDLFARSLSTHGTHSIRDIVAMRQPAPEVAVPAGVPVEDRCEEYPSCPCGEEEKPETVN